MKATSIFRVVVWSWLAYFDFHAALYDVSAWQFFYLAAGACCTYFVLDVFYSRNRDKRGIR